MRKFKWRGAQGTLGKQGNRDKRQLKLANSKRKMLNLTMKLLKNNNKKKNVEGDQSL